MAAETSHSWQNKVGEDRDKKTHGRDKKTNGRDKKTLGRDKKTHPHLPLKRKLRLLLALKNGDLNILKQEPPMPLL